MENIENKIANKEKIQDKDELRKSAFCITDNNLAQRWVWTIFNVVEFFMRMKNNNLNFYIEFKWIKVYSCDVETIDDVYLALFWMDESEYHEWYKNNLLESIKWTKRDIIDTVK